MPFLPLSLKSTRNHHDLVKLVPDHVFVWPYNPPHFALHGQVNLSCTLNLGLLSLHGLCALCLQQGVTETCFLPCAWNPVFKDCAQTSLIFASTQPNGKNNPGWELIVVQFVFSSQSYLLSHLTVADWESTGQIFNFFFFFKCFFFLFFWVQWQPHEDCFVSWPRLTVIHQ